MSKYYVDFMRAPVDFVSAFTKETGIVLQDARVTEQGDLILELPLGEDASEVNAESLLGIAEFFGVDLTNIVFERGGEEHMVVSVLDQNAYDFSEDLDDHILEHEMAYGNAYAQGYDAGRRDQSEDAIEPIDAEFTEVPTSEELDHWFYRVIEESKSVEKK